MGIDPATGVWLGRCLHAEWLGIDVETCCLSLNIAPSMYSMFFMCIIIGCASWAWLAFFLLTGPTMFVFIIYVAVADSEPCLSIGLTVQALSICLAMVALAHRCCSFQRHGAQAAEGMDPVDPPRFADVLTDAVAEVLTPRGGQRSSRSEQPLGLGAPRLTPRGTFRTVSSSALTPRGDGCYAPRGGGGLSTPRESHGAVSYRAQVQQPQPLPPAVFSPPYAPASHRSPPSHREAASMQSHREAASMQSHREAAWMQSHREAAWMQGQYVQAQGQYVQGHPVPLSAQTSPGQLVETEMLQVQLQMQMAQQHALHESIQRTAIMLETAREQESHRGMASHRGGMEPSWPSPHAQQYVPHPAAMYPKEHYASPDLANTWMQNAHLPPAAAYAVQGIGWDALKGGGANDDDGDVDFDELRREARKSSSGKHASGAPSESGYTSA